MSTAFENSHLAESVGFGTGRRRGHTEGWNAAVQQMTDRIADRDREIERLTNELRIANNAILNLRDYGERVKLRADTTADKLDLQIEHAQALRQENEQLLKAFFGVVSIAHPVIKAVAGFPLEQRNAMRVEYGTLAEQLQTPEYIADNNFPHNQPLIKKYLPIASSVFSQVAREIKEMKSGKLKNYTADI